MIRINLLPPETRRRKVASAQVVVPWRSLGMGSAALLAFVSGCLPVSNKLQANALDRLTSQWEAMAPQQARLEETQAALAALTTRARKLQEIHSQESKWAPRLNLLSDALVANLWFRRMTVAEDRTMRLEGSALGGGTGAPVSRFLMRLKEHPDFSRWFRELTLGGLEHQEIKGEEVVEFTLFLAPRS